jgi:hypothetical protein
MPVPHAALAASFCSDRQATAMMVLPAVQAMGQHALVLLVSWPGCVQLCASGTSPHYGMCLCRLCVTC